VGSSSKIHASVPVVVPVPARSPEGTGRPGRASSGKSARRALSCSARCWRGRPRWMCGPQGVPRMSSYAVRLRRGIPAGQLPEPQGRPSKGPRPPGYTGA
jgi:hypothetical protein